MRTLNHEVVQCFLLLSVDFLILLYIIHTFHYQSLVQIYKVDKNYSEKTNKIN